MIFRFLRIFYTLLLLISITSCKNTASGEYDYYNPWENWSFSFIHPDDPYFAYQWHLQNTGQPAATGTSGEDINVYPAWQAGFWGQYITVAVVDNGMAVNHEDLYDNNTRYLSYNYQTKTNDTTYANGYADHGTAVAGIIAATGWNNTGVIGIAPWAQLASYNAISVPTYANIKNALERDYKIIDVSNNSWGPSDSGQYYPQAYSQELAINNGLTFGRNGKGIVYVWAAGNGGSRNDNSNYDEGANYYGVIAVSAIGNNGTKASYSEEGANIWISAPSMGNNNKGVVTTDLFDIISDINLGSNDSSYTLGENYTDDFNGTSAAAPMVSGVAALILSANSNLSWRDVKLILAQTARQCDNTDPDWTTNSAVNPYTNNYYNINHKYGFGAVNAHAAVSLARNWIPKGKMKTYTTPVIKTGSSIPNSPSAFTNSIIIESNKTGINKIEYIAINIEIQHPASGQLEITLTSPGGTKSILSENHTTYTVSAGPTYTPSTGTYFTNSASYRFGTARCLDESTDGKWILSVSDGLNDTNNGILKEYSITFYGRYK